MKKNQRFRHDDLGWNYRMSSILCALGLGQIKNLRKNLIHKINIGKYYNNLLKNNKYIHLPIHKTHYSTNNYWVYPIVINKNSNKTEVDPQQQRKDLLEKNNSDQKKEDMWND